MSYLYLKGWRQLNQDRLEFSGQLVHWDDHVNNVLGYMSFIQFEYYVKVPDTDYWEGTCKDGSVYRLYLQNQAYPPENKGKFNWDYDD